MFQFCEQLIHHAGYSWGTILRSPQTSLLSQWRHSAPTSLDSSLFSSSCLFTPQSFITVWNSASFLVDFLSSSTRRQSLWRKKTRVFLVHCYWESQFLGRLIRSLGFPRKRKESGALQVEIGVWNSQGREKDKLFVSTFLKALVNYTTQIKLCTKDYVTTMYPVWGQFLRQFLEDSPPSWKPSD